MEKPLHQRPEDAEELTQQPHKEWHTEHIYNRLIACRNGTNQCLYRIKHKIITPITPSIISG